MPLKPLSFREVQRRLRAAGFTEGTQKGSHVKFIKQAGQIVITAIVPKHPQIAIGTLRSILRQAGLTVEEFERLV